VDIRRKHGRVLLSRSGTDFFSEATVLRPSLARF